MDFDRFEHQVDGGGSEDLAYQHHHGQLEAPSEIQGIEPEVKEFLPEGQMSRFDRNEFVERVVHVRLGNLSQRLVEREVKELVQHERSGEARVMGLWRGHEECREARRL